MESVSNEGITLPQCSTKSDDNIGNLEVILVNGVEFMVNKEYLSSISLYTWNAFFGPMKNKDNELNGVESDHFRVFLGVVNGEDCINDNNIEQALSTCAYLACDVALDACEKWIINKSGLNERRKFQLAVEHKLEGLKDAVLEDFTNILDVRKIVNNIAQMKKDWDKDTVMKVLGRLFSLIGVPQPPWPRSIAGVTRERDLLQVQIRALSEKMMGNSKRCKMTSKIVKRKKEKYAGTVYEYDAFWTHAEDGPRRERAVGLLSKILRYLGVNASVKTQQKNLAIQIRALQERKTLASSHIKVHEQVKKKRAECIRRCEMIEDAMNDARRQIEEIQGGARHLPEGPQREPEGRFQPVDRYMEMLQLLEVLERNFAREQRYLAGNHYFHLLYIE